MFQGCYLILLSLIAVLPPNTEIEKNSCGQVSVFAYLMLNLRSVDIDFEQIAALTPIGNKGSSISDLALTAGHMGIESRVIQANRETLKSLKVPVIAHLENHYLEDLESNFAESGHFVVVVSVSDKGLKLLDPIIGRVYPCSFEKFDYAWSGFLVVPASSLSSNRNSLVFLFAGCFVVFMVFIIRFRRKKGNAY